MVFGLFSKERALKRAIGKASNKLAQSEDRFAALEKLATAGTDEALYGLCRRFSFNYEKTIEDQQEKDWVVQTLVAKGEASLGAVRRYMKGAQSLHYPLMVLGQIADKKTALSVVDDVLGDEEPGYTRDPMRRIDLIDWLGEWDAAEPSEVAERVTPYLNDFDDNVRFKTVEALSLKPAPEAAGPLVDRLLSEEEDSKRIKLRIAEVLADNQMELGERKKEVAALFDDLLSDYKLYRDRLQRRKG